MAHANLALTLAAVIIAALVIRSPGDAGYVAAWLLLQFGGL